MCVILEVIERCKVIHMEESATNLDKNFQGIFYKIDGSFKFFLVSAD